MIELNENMCKELGLTYWQFKQKTQTNNNSNKPAYIFEFKPEQKDLLTKILLAKGVTLKANMLTIKDNDIVEVKTPSYRLIFDNVNKVDSKEIIHLAKLSDMLENQENKKHTWYKLKDLSL